LDRPPRISLSQGHCDVLLVHLSWHDDDIERSGVPQAPIGVAFVAAALRSIGLSVDCRVTTAEFDLEAVLDEVSPAAIGLSATGNEISQAIALAQLAKSRSPEAPIVVGGYASGDAEGLLMGGAVDVVVVGEGEATACELFPRLIDRQALGPVAGIVYKEPGGRVVRTAPRTAIEVLDSLALPLYEHAPMNTGVVRVYASRGCPFNCSFCRIKDYYSTPKIRFHSAEYVRAWLLGMIVRSECEIHTVYFNDDEFLLSPRHFNGMAHVVEELGLQMVFQTRAADIVRHASVIAAHAGCIRQVHIGIESFSQSQLNRWCKDTTVAINHEALAVLSSLRCSYYPYMILSDEHTSVQELAETVEGVIALPPCPLPGRPQTWISPLHSGLEFNRLKTFQGTLARSDATLYLEAVWRFLNATQPLAETLAAICRGGAPEARGAADLLERRLRAVPKIAEIATVCADLQACHQIGLSRALEFNEDAGKAVLEFGAKRLLGFERDVFAEAVA
jgi:hypothetical protein